MIRIPTQSDIDIQNAFFDVQEELERLRQSIDRIDASAPDTTSAEDAVELAQEKLNKLDFFSEIAEPPGIKKSGMPLRVLHQDGTWREIADGLISAVPSGTGGASTDQRVINVRGSVAVAPGGLSADSVRSRTAITEDIYVNGDMYSGFVNQGAPSGSKYGCSAYISSVQSVSATSSAAVSWAGTLFDDGGFWSAGSPTRLTAPVDGLYLIIGNFLFMSVAADKSVVGQIRVNAAPGSNYAHLNTSVASNIGTTVAAIRNLNAAQYVDLFMYNGDSTSRDLNANYTCLHIKRLGDKLS